VYPGSEVTPYGSPDLFKARNNRDFPASDAATGWSMGGAILDGDHAYKIMQNLILTGVGRQAR